MTLLLSRDGLLDKRRLHLSFSVLTQQSRDSVIAVINHHFTRVFIPGTNLNFIICLDLEILEEGVYTPLNPYYCRKKVSAQRLR